MAKLLKTPIRGGVLTLTNRELVIGEGWLGTQHVRRFPLDSLVAVEVQPSAIQRAPERNRLLRLRWNNGQITEVDGLGPIAAQRIRDMLHVLCRIGLR